MLQIGAAILGAIAGYFIGSALYSLIFFFFLNPYVILAVSIGSAIAGAVLSFKYFDGIVIFGTAFVGSYSIVRGASLIFGHYPDEITMFMKLINGVPEEIEY